MYILSCVLSILGKNLEWDCFDVVVLKDRGETVVILNIGVLNHPGAGLCRQTN